MLFVIYTSVLGVNVDELVANLQMTPRSLELQAVGRLTKYTEMSDGV